LNVAKYLLSFRGKCYMIGSSTSCEKSHINSYRITIRDSGERKSLESCKCRKEVREIKSHTLRSEIIHDLRNDDRCAPQIR